MRVLVIEDDEELARDGRRRLARARMAVDVALDGDAGLARALVHDYEVIVLDRDLPGVHGDEVCARLVAARRPQPGADADRSGGDRGPDRRARARRRRLPHQAVRLRRAARADRGAGPPGAAEHPAVLTHGDIVLDTAKRCAHRAGRPLALRPKEFGVLELLLAARAGSSPPRSCSNVSGTRPPTLHRRGEDHDQPTARQARRPAVIHTVAKAGYRI